MMVRRKLYNHGYGRGCSPMFATPYRHLTRKTLHSYSNRTSIDFAVGASHVVAWRCVHRKPPKGGTASYRQQKKVVHRTS